ncbi:DUF1453 domain-containing protein [Nocardia transvalensis]|uniref:DUF1453 domain-containing protein n=1 Tax=Nocardia transvalensis TaxID=37333 RepID=UPI001893E40E|nr:DUF1453 domain-containing protein [Nocardia transvalensis]MBF6329425.1 DUF1453 domain-containing protein [Nocardia transvalensis]
MTWTEWLISLALILLVLRQIRGKKLTVTGLLWPVGLVVWAGFEYLGDFPSYRSDWLFAIALAVLGTALGTACGLYTSVYTREGVVMAKAGATAAALWIIGMSGRLAFGLFALHGGAQTIAEWSTRLDLHSESTWPTALILMALCEVIARTAVLYIKFRTAGASVQPTGDTLAEPAASGN